MVLTTNCKPTHAPTAQISFTSPPFRPFVAKNIKPIIKAIEKPPKLSNIPTPLTKENKQPKKIVGKVRTLYILYFVMSV